MISPRKFNPTLIWAAVTAVLILALICQHCNTSNNSSSSLDPLKQELAALKVTRDDAQKLIDSIAATLKPLHDTVMVYRTRYKTIRHDSIIPCETKLNACDSALAKDSALMATQDKQIGALASKDTISSRIILAQDSIISMDSTTIAGNNKVIDKLNGKVKRLRIAFVAGYGLGVITGAAVAR